MNQDPRNHPKVRAHMLNAWIAEEAELQRKNMNRQVIFRPSPHTPHKYTHTTSGRSQKARIYKRRKFTDAS